MYVICGVVSLGYSALQDDYTEGVPKSWVVSVSETVKIRPDIGWLSAVSLRHWRPYGDMGSVPANARTAQSNSSMAPHPENGGRSFAPFVGVEFGIFNSFSGGVTVGGLGFPCTTCASRNIGFPKKLSKSMDFSNFPLPLEYQMLYETETGKRAKEKKKRKNKSAEGRWI